MYQMYQANMANLTSLWKRYGATPSPHQAGLKFYRNEGWPHRAWLEIETAKDWLRDFSMAQLYKELSELISPAEIIPVINRSSFLHHDNSYDLCEPDDFMKDSPCELSFCQTAMFAEKSKLDWSLVGDSETISFRKVACHEGLNVWTKICGEAFDYEIDKQNIYRLINDPETDILLGLIDDFPVMTALVHRTNNVAGLHQFGVHPTYQGRGLASIGMKLLVKEWIKERYITLQASEAGYPLYKKLGFHDQFEILNYTKVDYEN